MKGEYLRGKRGQPGVPDIPEYDFFEGYEKLSGSRHIKSALV